MSRLVAVEHPETRDGITIVSQYDRRGRRFDLHGRVVAMGGGFHGTAELEQRCDVGAGFVIDSRRRTLIACDVHTAAVFAEQELAKFEAEINARFGAANTIAKEDQ